MLDATAKMVRCAGFPQATIGANEIVVLNARAGKYHGLRGTASRIWELLQSPTTIDDMCAVLVGEFDVELEACRRDVTEFVQQLADENLIEQCT